MGVDYNGFAFPKAQKLRVEAKREKRLVDEAMEDAARAAVRVRDGMRCSVPGCREKGTELHHIVRRSRSKAKRWEISNLCYLCHAHHSLEHGGKIHIARKADGELIVTGARKYLEFRL